MIKYRLISQIAWYISLAIAGSVKPSLASEVNPSVSSQAYGQQKSPISVSAQDLRLEPSDEQQLSQTPTQEAEFPDKLVPQLPQPAAPSVPAAEDELPLAPNPATPPQQTTPQAVPPALKPSNPAGINPFTTTIPLNGDTVTHLSEWQLSPGISFGTDRSTNLKLDGLLKIDGSLKEGIQNNVFVQDQRGLYLQIRNRQRERQIHTTRTTPVTATGVQTQITVTGACINQSFSFGEFCTYTPGIRADLDSLDPATLFPTRFIGTSDFYDVVAPETIEFIKQPGFQSGLPGGQQIGIDLTLPNTSTVFSNNQSQITSVNREEDFREYPTGIFSQVRQIIKVNDQEAVIGRTIRGSALVLPNDDFLAATAWQPVAWLLPDAVPKLKGGEAPPSRNINRNLFFAANNTRIPDSSYTVYQAGLGQAQNLDPAKVKRIQDIPWGRFNSVWVGLSPVITRSIDTTTTLIPTSGITSTTGAIGSEGGGNVNDTLNIPVIIVTPDALTEINPINIANFYTQVYVTAFTFDANQVSKTRFSELTNYVPHISFSGNFTGTEDVIRYHAGVITSDKLKAYLGADYTRSTPGGWRFNFAGIGYTNPDADYYSSIASSISKRTRLDRNWSVTFGAGLNYAIDRNTNIDRFVINNDSSSITLNTQANYKNKFSFGVVGVIGDVLPNAKESSITLTSRFQVNPYVGLLAYYSPLNNNTSFSRMGAGVNLRLGQDPNDLSLNFLWANNRYGFGVDPGNNALVNSENTFSLVLNFGAPANPFQRGQRSLPQQQQKMLQQLDPSNEGQDTNPQTGPVTPAELDSNP